uniref:Transmembrane protein 106A (inferred by orthology to a human protein) n=1 Tax=Strongyloides venezuelensis TaxID=75913 RepID=A0A0K0EYS0_STRVS
MANRLTSPINQFLSSIRQRVSGMNSDTSHLIASEEQQSSSSVNDKKDERTSNITTQNNTMSSDYTELMNGSVPCPSCNGSGRIPKEMEETLVALIPVNDARLKPKRTCIWVSIGIGICLLLASAAIFMLVPRPITLTSLKHPIETVNISSKREDQIDFHFLNSINITNANYFAVKVSNITSNIINKFQPWSSDIIGSGLNSTTRTIMPLSYTGNTLWFNNSVSLKGYVAQYCQSNIAQLTPLYVTMQFDVSVIVEYLQHLETVSLSTTQSVCCVPSGNCTLQG